MRTELVDFAGRVLGGCRVVADRSWSHGNSSVLEVCDPAGETWYVKGHHRRQNYQYERIAYERWTPSLGRSAARLRAYDERLPALLLSGLPGEPALQTGMDSAVQRRAGALLRQFHAAESLPPQPDLIAKKLSELDGLARSDLLARPEVQFVRARLRDIDQLVARRPLVPCHHDYNLRNWLTCDDRIHVIDFEWAQPDVWVNDLIRLYVGPWQGRPELRAAFLDGYGRSPDADDFAILRGCAAFMMVFIIVWADRHGEASFSENCRANLQRLMTGAL